MGIKSAVAAAFGLKRPPKPRMMQTHFQTMDARLYAYDFRLLAHAVEPTHPAFALRVVAPVDGDLKPTIVQAVQPTVAPQFRPNPLITPELATSFIMNGH